MIITILLISILFICFIVDMYCFIVADTPRRCDFKYILPFGGIFALKKYGKKKR